MIQKILVTIRTNDKSVGRNLSDMIQELILDTCAENKDVLETKTDYFEREEMFNNVKRNGIKRRKQTDGKIIK